MAIVALLVTNGATLWTTKLYYGKFSQAVAECNADKLESALEAEKAARRGQAAAHAEELSILAQEAEAKDEALRRQHTRLQELIGVRKALRSRLNEEINRNWDDCIVRDVPGGVRDAIKDSYEAYFGGGSEADPDTPAS